MNENNSNEKNKDTKVSINNENKNKDASVQPVSALEHEINIPFLLKFALPTMFAIVFMGAFGIIDGVFVSRLIDSNALAAVGLIGPFFTFAMSIGMMFGCGGNAIVGKEIGEGNIEKARETFTLLVAATFVISTAIAIISLIFPDVILYILGVDREVYDIAKEYLMPSIFFLPLICTNMMFNQFLITEGKAHYGMMMSILSGGVNIFFNWFLIDYLYLGLHGAALASCIGFSVPAIFGFIYFTINKRNIRAVLYFVKPKLRIDALVKAAINGSSEMVTLLSTAITGTLLNNVLMDIDGPDAVAAIGITMGMQTLVAGIFLGYAGGVAPIVSYNYGKQDRARLKKLFRNGLLIAGSLSLVSMAISWTFTDMFIGIYIEEPLMYLGGFLMTLPVYDMAFTGIRMFSFAFIFSSITAICSGFFTSMGNGKISAVISFSQTLLFSSASILLLPRIFGLAGVWFTTPVAAMLGMLVAVYFSMKFRKRYGYA